MSKQTTQTKRRYSLEFKGQAIELAKELGAQKAAGKLGIRNVQTIRAWVRYDKKMAKDADFRTSEELRAEVKRLKKKNWKANEKL